MPEDKHPTSESLPEPAGVSMYEGVPDERLVSRRMSVLGGVEVDHQRYHSDDELRVPSLKGHNLTLHRSGPHRLIHRREELSHEGTGIKGTVHVVPPGPPVEWIWDGEPENVSMLLEDGFLRSVAAGAGADPDRFEVLHRFGERDQQMERLMLSFLPELETGGLGGELYAQGLAQALAVHLLREHSSLGAKAKRKAAQEPKGGLSARALKRATDFVGDNLSGDLSLAELAAAANLSPHHFARLFKESTGLPPHRYVVRERVEKAKGLLKDTELPAGEVARLCGFSNQGHLNLHFKRAFGVAPGAFRRG